jgi:hypothetical protein
MIQVLKIVKEGIQIIIIKSSIVVIGCRDRVYVVSSYVTYDGT